ncbi:MAG: putative motility protein [Betaproteobacteria bacterium]|nr:putative motility protein [Betaproteobacteria bacterium]
MNVSGVATSVTQMPQARMTDAAQVAAPKQTVYVPAHGVMHLVQSASMTLTSNPPHLGNKVDTFA